MHSHPLGCRSLTLSVKSGVWAAMQSAVICNTVSIIGPDQPFLHLVLLTDLHLLPLLPPTTLTHIHLLRHTRTHADWVTIFAPNPPFISRIHWWQRRSLVGKQLLQVSNAFSDSAFSVIAKRKGWWSHLGSELLRDSFFLFFFSRIFSDVGGIADCSSQRHPQTNSPTQKKKLP